VVIHLAATWNVENPDRTLAMPHQIFVDSTICKFSQAKIYSNIANRVFGAGQRNLAMPKIKAVE
jgi:hypothetical protein